MADSYSWMIVCVLITGTTMARQTSITDQRAQVCLCPTNMDAICASDGVTTYSYLNRCVLECNQKRRPELRWIYDGLCCSMAACPMRKRSMNDVVQLKSCYYYYAQCLESRMSSQIVFSEYVPNKIDSCKRSCTLENQPVCDSDGNTHRNLCIFRSSKCIAKLHHNVELQIAYFGSCCNSLCQRRSQPVLTICDDLGETHNTLCDFYVARCLAQRKFGISLRIFGLGACPPRWSR